jgi:hypothetical protein
MDIERIHFIKIFFSFLMCAEIPPTPAIYYLARCYRGDPRRMFRKKSPQVHMYLLHKMAVPLY